MKKKFSAKKYIKEKGRLLPIEKCYLADGYENRGLTVALIVRRQPSGNFAFANFVIDRLCMGVKNAFANCNASEQDIEEYINRMEGNGDVEEITAEYLHNLVYASVDYAQELGILPDKDFKTAEYLLDEDLITDKIDNIEFGIDDKPFYIEGPFDNTKHILGLLTRSVGDDGFEFVKHQA